MALDKLVERFGEPTKSFNIPSGRSHWWAAKTLEEFQEVANLEGVTATGVYRNPALVEGGQLYDINFVEPN